jgi:hypothetical protein
MLVLIDFIPHFNYCGSTRLSFKAQKYANGHHSDRWTLIRQSSRNYNNNSNNSSIQLATIMRRMESAFLVMSAAIASSWLYPFYIASNTAASTN